MELLTALLLLLGLPLILFGPGFAWSLVVAPLRPANPEDALDPWLRGLIAFAGSAILETLSILALHFLGVPINGWTIALLLVALIVPPILVLQARAARDRAPPPEPGPEPAPAAGEGNPPPLYEAEAEGESASPAPDQTSPTTTAAPNPPPQPPPPGAPRDPSAPPGAPTP